MALVQPLSAPARFDGWLSLQDSWSLVHQGWSADQIETEFGLRSDELHWSIQEHGRVDIAVQNSDEVVAWVPEGDPPPLIMPGQLG